VETEIELLLQKSLSKNQLLAGYVSSNHRSL